MENILVKDMMVPLADYVTVSDKATLAEAVAALKKAQQEFDKDRYRHRAVLVLDQRGKVVGKVSQISALKALEPKYRGLGDLNELEGLYGLKADSIRQMITDHGLWKSPIDDICMRGMSPGTQGFGHSLSCVPPREQGVEYSFTEQRCSRALNSMIPACRSKG